MLPEDLFTRHSQQADKLALDLCHFYAVSGALAYRDEACSEAKLALWKQAVTFNPAKQLMQRVVAEESYWAALIGYDMPVPKYRDPYDTFWISSIQRVRGAVLDFFRSQRLITKLPKILPGEKQIRTMLYYERFVSMNKPISSVVGNRASHEQESGTETFGDFLLSKDRTDSNDDRRDMRLRIELLTKRAGLTSKEYRIIILTFTEDEHDAKEISIILGIPEAKVKKMKSEALAKMRGAVMPMERKLETDQDREVAYTLALLGEL